MPTNKTISTAAIKNVSKIKYRADDGHDVQINNAPASLDFKHFASQDIVAIEEPLLVTLCYFEQQTSSYQSIKLTLMMRTPGNDKQLVTGLLFAENIIACANDIESILVTENDGNQVEVTLSTKVSFDKSQITQALTAHSSCGLCGKNTLNALALKTNNRMNNDENWLSAQQITRYCQFLSQQQPLFEQTGGVHGASYMNEDNCLAAFEDVGRHNAVDKLIGYLLSNNKFTDHGVLVLSGRISYELMQKVIVAGVSVVVALGAPSSLAISAAKQFNVTLIGFVKNTQFNVYHGNHRICQQ